LRGREGFGFDEFRENETPIFHCVGGEEIEAKGSLWGDRTLHRTRLVRSVSSTGRHMR
jgi:hypothetical protein